MSIQSSSSSAPGSPLSSPTGTMHQQVSEEPDISRICLGGRGDEDGAVEMSQAETSSPANPNVITNAPVNNLPSIPIKFSLVLSSSDTSRNPVDVAKKLVTKRDYYLSLLNDTIVEIADDDANGQQQHMVEIRSIVEELNRTISTIKHSVKLSGERVAASINDIT